MQYKGERERFSIRLPVELASDLRERADACEITLNEFVEAILREAVDSSVKVELREQSKGQKNGKR